MSTIKSSDEHLTINADGSGNDIKFQSNGTEVASISDGGVVTSTGMLIADSGTIGSASDTDAIQIASNGETSFTSGVKLADNKKIKFGSDEDLEIYHDGSDSYIKDAGTGDLIVRGDTNFKVQNASGSHNKIIATGGGSVELYENNVKKLETTANGIEIQGEIEINSGFEFTGEGGNTRMSIAHNTGNVWIDGNCSAASFTDRTPYPETLQLAYDVINSHKKLPDGQYKADDHSKQLDHSQLHEYVKADENNRNMSGVISCLVEVIKDLEARIAALEA